MLSVSRLTIVSGGSGHQTEHAAALAEGLKQHGVGATILGRCGLVTTKYVACWGWRMGRPLRARGHEVLVMERGYIGDRFAWSSLGWNGLNGRATFYPRDDPARFEMYFGSLLKPWKDGGEYVLVIGQVPGDASLQGRDLSAWYLGAAKQAAQAYGLPAYFRPHPVTVQRNMHPPRLPGVQKMNGELHKALDNAAAVVTWNSNTAVEAVLAGVPTVAIDDGTMARPVTAKCIGERITPERRQWATRLAWCQWTMDEIRSGAAWEAVRPR